MEKKRGFRFIFGMGRGNKRGTIYSKQKLYKSYGLLNDL